MIHLELNDSSKICVEEQSESSQADPSHAPRTSSSNVERERFSSLLSGLVQTASSIAPHGLEIFFYSFCYISVYLSFVEVDCPKHV